MYYHVVVQLNASQTIFGVRICMPPNEDFGKSKRTFKDELYEPPNEHFGPSKLRGEDLLKQLYAPQPSKDFWKTEQSDACAFLKYFSRV